MQNDPHHLEAIAQIPDYSFVDLHNAYLFLAFFRWHTFSFINESKQKLMKTTAFVLILFCLASFTSCTKTNKATALKPLKIKMKKNWKIQIWKMMLNSRYPQLMLV